MLVRRMGGKDPATCNRGLYRLATDTGTWTTLERGLPAEVEVRCVTLHPTQPIAMSNPAFTFDHIHIISQTPHVSANWYVEMFGTEIVADTIAYDASRRGGLC
jgi:hypothetical protein